MSERRDWQLKLLEELPPDELLEAARWYRQAWLELCDGIAKIRNEMRRPGRQPQTTGGTSRREGET